jgi:hypothetical protein
MFNLDPINTPRVDDSVNEQIAATLNPVNYSHLFGITINNHK